MKILVTGGAGFIGSNLAEELITMKKDRFLLQNVVQINKKRKTTIFIPIIILTE